MGIRPWTSASHLALSFSVHLYMPALELGNVVSFHGRSKMMVLEQEGVYACRSVHPLSHAPFSVDGCYAVNIYETALSPIAGARRCLYVSADLFT